MNPAPRMFDQYTPAELLGMSAGLVKTRLALSGRAVAVLAASEAARHYGVPAPQLFRVTARARDGGTGQICQEARHARAFALYVLHIIFSYPQHEAGDLFGVSGNLVKKAVRRVEEARDGDAPLNTLLERFEQLARLLDEAGDDE